MSNSSRIDWVMVMMLVIRIERANKFLEVVIVGGVQGVTTVDDPVGVFVQDKHLLVDKALVPVHAARDLSWCPKEASQSNDDFL